MLSILEVPELRGRPQRRSGVDPLDPDALRRYALIAPDDWRRWFYLGFYYDQACQSNEAIEAYSTVIPLAPHIGLEHYLLGKAKVSERADKHIIALSAINRRNKRRHDGQPMECRYT